jgi:hypothetical protein
MFGNGCLNALCKYSKGLVLLKKLFLSFMFSTITFSTTVRKSKGKGHPITGHEGPTGGVEV